MQTLDRILEKLWGRDERAQPWILSEEFFFGGGIEYATWTGPCENGGGQDRRSRTAGVKAVPGGRRRERRKQAMRPNRCLQRLFFFFFILLELPGGAS